MKIKIEIKNKWTGKILFEYEKENNTIKDTVVEAVRSGANLYGADLCHANLSGANLSGADFCLADLSDANLRNADLRNANLYSADLCGTYLSNANLYCADLSNACLYGADLNGANLSGVAFYSANLSNANLSDANLYSADLYSADLSDANLNDADLRNANLYCAKNIPHIPLNCPSDGAFIGWKKVKDKLVKLEVPEDAKRSSATTMKCWCDKAKVLAITDLDGENPIGEILCETNTPLLYKVGEIVYPDSFGENRWNECSHGIHFFINKQDAIDY